MNTHSKNNTLKDTGFRELGIRRNGLLAFETNDFLNLLVLRKHFRMVEVSTSVNVGENAESFIPSVLVGQPTWGFREKEETADKKCRRKGLDTPWDTESLAGLVWVIGTTAVERSAILDEILDKDTLEFESD